MSPISCRRSLLVGLAVLATLSFTVPAAATAATPATVVSTPDADPFYTPPSPLPPGQPGDVIRSRQVPVSVLGLPVPVTAWQVLYRSTSATSEPIAVSGTVLVPMVPWLSGPRPLVTYAVGAHGLGDQCAPSYNLRTGTENEVALIGQFLARGWAVVITDYQGLGTPGVHTFGVGQASGRSMLDAARAAQRLNGPGLSPNGQVGIYGFSQGGQAAAFAGELQPSYAPELTVAGIAAGGVPRDLAGVARYLNGGPAFGLVLGAIAGYHSAYPELPYDQLFNANGRELVSEVSTQCVIGGLPITGAFKSFKDLSDAPDPLTNPQWLARLAENVPGQHKPTAPVFLFHGDLDELIPFSIARPLKDSYCGLGATVQWTTIPLSEHITANIEGLPLVTTWLAGRFAGAAARNEC